MPAAQQGQSKIFVHLLCNPYFAMLLPIFITRSEGCGKQKAASKELLVLKNERKLDLPLKNNL